MQYQLLIIGWVEGVEPYELVLNRVTLSLIYLFFSLNHWVFSWNYFRAACLFKLSFGDHSIESCNTITERKKTLRNANYAAYIIICLCCSTMIAIALAQVDDKLLFL